MYFLGKCQVLKFALINVFSSIAVTEVLLYLISSSIMCTLLIGLQAEIARHSTAERQWEVYRFLLDESPEYPLASKRARTEILEKVKRTLMGW